MFIGFIVQILWSQMLDISFLPMNSFIAISIPGTPSTIQSVMIKYIYFDIFYTEFWIDKFMESIGIPFSTLENDHALNSQFSDNGYESKLFLKNSGSSIFLLIIYLSSWGILLIFAFLSLNSNKIRILK
jgi:hypothetical protein